MTDALRPSGSSGTATSPSSSWTTRRSTSSTPAVFDALESVVGELVALTDPARADRARAVLFEARGKVVSGGVDVTFFRDIAEGPEPAGARRRPLGAAAPGRPGRSRTCRCPRSSPRTGSRLTAAFEISPVLRHPAGRGEGVVRAGRDRRRPDPVDGRAAAAGRAGRPGAGAGADLHRRAVPGRRPGAVERGQPGAAGRGLRRGGPRLRRTGSPPAPRSRTRPPRRWSATSVREGARAADALVPEVSGALFATEDLRGAVASFLADGPGKATLLRALTPGGRPGSGPPHGANAGFGGSCAGRLDRSAVHLKAHSRSRKAGSRVLARHLPRRLRA